MLDLRSWQARLVFGFTALSIGLFLFLPIYWLTISSFKADAELYRIIPSAFPEAFTLKHFKTAIFEGEVFVQLKNSLIVSLSSAGINTILAL